MGDNLTSPNFTFPIRNLMFNAFGISERSHPSNFGEKFHRKKRTKEQTIDLGPGSRRFPFPKRIPLSPVSFLDSLSPLVPPRLLVQEMAGSPNSQAVPRVLV